VLRTFTATRAPQAGDTKRLASYSLSAGATPLVVNFCNGSAAAPIFQVQVPALGSKSVGFDQPSLPVFVNGLHVEVVSGTLNRGAIALQ
jgi:hypothetical protein